MCKRLMKTIMYRKDEISDLGTSSLSEIGRRINKVLEHIEIKE